MPNSRTPIRRVIATAVTAASMLALLGGCGFIAAGNKSAVKPSAFVLTGQASVALPAGAPAIGSPCQSPTGATDVATNVVVTVTGADGTKIGTGRLGSGIVTGSGSALSCSFPFQITGVQGGASSYDIAIGNRPTQSFSGDALRQGTTAVVTIAP